MENRDMRGRFIKGSPGGPGRKKAKYKVFNPVNPTYREQYVTRDKGGRFVPGTGGNPSVKGDKIYIVWHEGDFYKIGICKNAKSRMGMLNSNTPYNAEMIYLRKVESPIDVEYAIKEMFVEKNVKGEWYKFSEDDIEFIQSFIETHSSGNKALQMDLFSNLIAGEVQE